MITKSLYNKQSIIDAVNTDASKFGQYAIKIVSPSLGTIAGILKEAINFSVDASWSTLGLEGVIDAIMSSNGILNAIDTALDVTNLASGSSFTNTGIFSKLFYKNSGRLGISPSFRIFDFGGTGICTRAVTTLTALCIPKIQEGKSVSLEEATSNASELVTSAASFAKDSKIVQEVAENAKTGLKRIGDSSANWSNAPDPVSIQIGNWLIIDQAVVQNVSFNFSYECTDSGPVWVDISMKLESIENIYIDTDGSLAQVKIGDTLNKGRVTIKNNDANTRSDYAQIF